MKKLTGWLLVLLLVLSSLSYAVADAPIDEFWGKPTYVYGAGLTEEQILQTAGLLGIANIENVNPVKISAADLKRYIGGSPQDASMISSALVTRHDDGFGVQVKVLTPDNISEITPDMYANAAITSGVTNAEVAIGAYRRVTGESALAGIFKAFEANGEVLDTTRMELGQDELETVNDISQQNKDKTDFDLDKFNQVIIEIKQQLAALKETTGKLATKEDIERIINEALTKYDLAQVVTREQIEKLLGFFEKYQSSGAIDTAAVKEQLTELSKNVTDKIKDLVGEAEAQGIFAKIVQFFSELFQGIIDLFKSVG